MTAPTILKRYTHADFQFPLGISVAGGHAYVASPNNGKLVVLDVSDPGAPAWRASVSLIDPRHVAVTAGVAYVTTDTNGRIYTVDVSNPGVPGKVGVRNDVLGVRMVAHGGRLYMTRSTVTDSMAVFYPPSIVPATSISVQGSSAGLGGVTVVGGYAYAVNGDDGVRVFDLSAETALARFTPGGLFPQVASDGSRYLYVSTYDGVVRVYDTAASPGAPVLVGSVTAATSSTQDLVYADGYLYLAQSGHVLQVDVTDPAAPAVTGTTPVPGGSVRHIAHDAGHLYVTTYADGGTPAGVTVLAINRPPFAPTLTAPGTGAVVSVASGNYLSWMFNDPDRGDSQSAYRVRYRPVGTPAWVDTGWVTSTSARHLVPGWTFSAADYEWQVATKDSYGEAGPFSPSGFFTATTPPPGPTITAPANGAVIPTSSATLVWSVPDQDAYQLQVLDGATVVFDTGQVNDPSARARAVEFTTNNTTRTIQLRILHEGLWSPWAQVTVTVSYTPPAVPSIALQSDDRVGSVTVTPGIPAPATGEPSVVAFDTWVRRVGDTGDGTRLARDVPPSLDHTWWTPASGVDYEFRIQVRGDNDTTTWSPWAGGPARYDESTYDAAAYA